MLCFRLESRHQGVQKAHMKNMSPLRRRNRLLRSQNSLQIHRDGVLEYVLPLEMKLDMKRKMMAKLGAKWPRSKPLPE